MSELTMLLSDMTLVELVDAYSHRHSHALWWTTDEFNTEFRRRDAEAARLRAENEALKAEAIELKVERDTLQSRIVGLEEYRRLHELGDSVVICPFCNEVYALMEHSVCPLCHQKYRDEFTPDVPANAAPASGAYRWEQSANGGNDSTLPSGGDSGDESEAT